MILIAIELRECDAASIKILTGKVVERLGIE
jgi:hypothetical protein